MTGIARHPHDIRAHPARPHRIELKLRQLDQLFNSMDPSPFHEKDLDDDAEAFIESWASEHPPGDPVALIVHLDVWPKTGDTRAIVRQAVRRHFAYRAELQRLELRRLLATGRLSLIIGALFLAACLFAAQTLADGGWSGLLRESLTIAGWVAMWRPMEIYLYDWWPVRRRIRICAKLARMPVEVLPGRGREPGEAGLLPVTG